MHPNPPPAKTPASTRTGGGDDAGIGMGDEQSEEGGLVGGKGTYASMPKGVKRVTMVLFLLAFALWWTIFRFLKVGYVERCVTHVTVPPDEVVTVCKNETVHCIRQCTYNSCICGCMNYEWYDGGKPTDSATDDCADEQPTRRLDADDVNDTTYGKVTVKVPPFPNTASPRMKWRGTYSNWADPDDDEGVTTADVVFQSKQYDGVQFGGETETWDPNLSWKKGGRMSEWLGYFVKNDDPPHKVYYMSKTKGKNDVAILSHDYEARLCYMCGAQPVTFRFYTKPKAVGDGSQIVVDQGATCTFTTGNSGSQHGETVTWTCPSHDYICDLSSHKKYFTCTENLGPYGHAYFKTFMAESDSASDTN